MNDWMICSPTVELERALGRSFEHPCDTHAKLQSDLYGNMHTDRMCEAEVFAHFYFALHALGSDDRK